MRARIPRRKKPLSREVLAGLSQGRAGASSLGRRGDEAGDPGVPHLPPRPDHTRAGRAATYGPRRVPGLRREEVAVLAGVSVDVLRPPRTRKRERRLRRRAGGARPRAPARRRRTRPPLRPRPRRPADRARRRAGVAPSRASARASSGSLDAITGAAAFVGNGRLDILAANRSAARCSPSCTPRPPGRATTPGSSSSTRAPRRSTPTGTAPPATPPRSSAPKPAATRTTASCPTSSASSPPERGVPHPLGRPQRTLPRHRGQALPPPRRRRARASASRPAGHRRRPRADALHLRRRARLPLRRRR